MLSSEIQSTSENLEAQDLDDIIILHFNTNAKIFGENFSLKGDSITVFAEKDEKIDISNSKLSSIREIHSEGNASFSQKIYSGKGDLISIYPSSKLLIITGNAEIIDPEHGIVSGERLTLDNATKKIKTEGSKSKRSVISIDDIENYIKSTNDNNVKTSNEVHNDESERRN